MYFKRIEIFGFKSFPKRTRVDFEPGITAIVGPNGCGKTNIVEAIRWVLGEQSPHRLRGEKMEEVIFNGTREHKPLNIAEASLFIDNTGKQVPLAYEEIMITRRIFRSGESEYFINRKPVRLKDITELFMDTGMNINAYSMMEQGKVNFLMKAQPEERRVIFEEAAGVTRYKARKQEARTKLERVKQDLIRLEDILKEIGSQLGSLKYQVRKAQQFQKYKQKLQTFQINLLVQRILDLREKRKDGQAKSKQVLHKIKELNNLVTRKDNTTRKNKQQLKILEEETASLQTRKFEIAAQTNLSRQLIDNLKQRQQELETTREEREAQIKNLQARGSHYEKDLLQAQKECAELEKQIASQQKELEKKETGLAALEKELGKEKKKLEQGENTLAELNAKISEITAKLTRFEVEKKLRLENIDKLRLEIEAQRKKGERGQEITPEAVAIQWMRRQKFSGVCGSLEELIEVPGKYQKVIESVLNYRLHSLVVENSQVAWEVVEKLKREGKGKLFIFPLDMVGLQTETKIETEKGIRAGEVVKYSEKYKKLINYLLGRVVLVEKLPALNLPLGRGGSGQAQPHAQYYLVDLEGNIIYPSGEIYGGGEQIPRVEQERRILTAELEKSEQPIRELAEKIRSLENKKGKTKDELENTRQKVLRLTEEAHNGQERIAHLKISISTRRGELANKKFLWERNRQVSAEDQEAVKRAEKQLKDLDLAKNKAREDEVNELKKIKDLAKEKTEVEENFQQKEHQCSLLASQINQQQEEIFQLEQELKDWQAKEQESKVEMAGYQAKLEEVEGELSREYGLSLEQLPATGQEEEIPVGKVEELKRKLDSFGGVNLSAPGEYQKLQEREKFLLQQKNDLVEAQDNLSKLIDKIETTIRKQFNENFTSVRKNFQEIFKKLFEGGEGDLILTNEKDLLSAGVDIVAQPPGKRLQNIALLSEGEKALTAIALLFALFKVKPSPLCILDEVDAPLDEANLRRFSRMLKEFTGKSQMMVITHNKATMEICDLLYGVTMEESGVSKIVSVKFRKE